MYLFRLIYYSRNAIPETGKPQRAELKSILDACKRNNPPLGVTGALMFNQTHFAQVLEGDRQAVTQTFCRIANDPRHADIVIHDARPIDARRFADWSMGFVGAPQGHELYRRYCTSSDFNPAKMTAKSLLGFMTELAESAPDIVRSDRPKTGIPTAAKTREPVPV